MTFLGCQKTYWQHLPVASPPKIIMETTPELKMEEVEMLEMWTGWKMLDDSPKFPGRLVKKHKSRMMVSFFFKLDSRGLFSYIPVNILEYLACCTRLETSNFEPQSHGGLDGSGDFPFQKNGKMGGFLGEPAVKHFPGLYIGDSKLGPPMELLRRGGFTHPGERGNSRHMFRFVSRRFFLQFPYWLKTTQGTPSRSQRGKCSSGWEGS